MAEPGTGARTGPEDGPFSSASHSAAKAGRSFVSASRTTARASAAVAGGAAGIVHRMTRASGAGRTGLANLIELTAAGNLGDAFVAVALAGTLFFNTSLNQARSEVALYLLITMAPFAVLAPFIGPMLDRVQNGRRYILAGTLLARGLLCWAMSAALHHDPVTLFPSAFGVLILQKAYGVTRAAITPRLLPAELTLVSANARSTLAGLITSSLGVVIAAGISFVGGAAWVLRFGALVYLAATILSFRLPDSVDAVAPAGRSAAGSPEDARQTQPERPVRPGTAPHGQQAYGQVPPGQAAPGQPYGPGYGPPPGQPPPGQPQQARPRQARSRPASHGGLRALRNVGPVVGEAMRGNAALRAFSGFMLFFLAFLLRADHFHGISHDTALAALAAAVAGGGFVGTAVGSRMRSRQPHLIVFGMLGLAMVITAACAWFFGLWAALIVAFVAASAQALVKLALDSTVQREIGEDIRSSTFAVSETLNQLSWVLGGLAGLALSLTSSGIAGLTVAAIGLAAALGLLVAGRRHRIVTARPMAPSGSVA
jgi:MFS family permease